MVEYSHFDGEWMFDIYVTFCSIVVDDSWGTFNPLTADIKYTTHGVRFFKHQMLGRDDGH
jgi:hypothetical protein